MKVRAYPSQYRDNFARLSLSLIRILERDGLCPFTSILKVADLKGNTGYFWPAQEASLLKAEAIIIPGQFSGEVNIRLIDIKSVKSAKRIVVRPVQWVDQMLAVEMADMLAESTILEQARLAYKDASIPIYLPDGRVINFKLVSYDLNSESVVKLVIDTEVEIEQPHIEPKTNSSSASVDLEHSLMSLMFDPKVPKGFARFNLADLIDKGWKTLGERVYFSIEPLLTSIEAFGLVGTAGSSKHIRRGTLHISPEYALDGLLNTALVRVSAVDTSKASILDSLKVEVPFDSNLLSIDSLFADFKCKDSFLLPSGLFSSTFKAPMAKERFLKIDLDAKLNIEYNLRPARQPSLHDISGQERELLKILKSGAEDVLVITGETKSGKSALARYLQDSEGCILFDFEPYFKNLIVVHAFIDEIISCEAFLLKSSPVIFDHIDWILNPEGLESLHEDDRWAYSQLKDKFIDLCLKMTRPVVLVISLRTQIYKVAPKLYALTVYNHILDKKSEVKIRNKPSENNSALPWDQCLGQDEAKTMLEESIIWPIKWSDLYTANGLSKFSAVLLYGSTGSGKTALMNSLTTALPSVHVIRVRGPELLSKYIGSSEEAVRQVFLEARSKKPALILFDEIDSLAPRRGHDNTGVTDRVVNQLLTEIDGTGEREGIFIVAATSRKDLIDPALLRSGRIDCHIEVKMPDEGGRRNIIKQMLGTAVSAENVEQLVVATRGFSPARIKSTLFDSQIANLRIGPEQDTNHIETALRIASEESKSPTFESIPSFKQRATFA